MTVGNNLEAEASVDYQKTTATGEELLQLVSFKLGEEEFGVDILKVQEINRLVEITKVPRTPDFVEGVINLRGKVIPIIDLRKRFGLNLKDNDKDTRIVVIDIDGSIMGMIVDAVSEVLRLPESTIEPAPEIATSIDSEYIRGVAKLEDRLLIFLDLSKVFSQQERAVMNQIQQSMEE
ncbi:MAG: chemotaxis protein CheW [candidate division Zixibacteria bacterium]|jgi:purine-binding chemotaxis protein CheW|nr:chemotaxis protein CheW [candidate division Zixibacteria bacterium]